jgi:hypothetical protein
VQDALIFAFTAALNPTLLAATMVMLFAAQPRRLMSGYLLGAYTVSISLGLLIVFALHNRGAVETTERTLSPAADVVLGLLLLLIAGVIHTERDAHLRARRRRATDKQAPRWKRALDAGSPRTAFVVGIALTLPGASYLVGLSRISHANAAALPTTLAVVLFNVIMLALIEIPVLGFAVQPDATRHRVTRFTDWVSTNARTIIARIAFVLGALLLARAVITVLS